MLYEVITHHRHTCPWVWRCHVDLSHPNAELWEYLSGFIDQYDAVVLSLPEYAQQIGPPQFFIMPAINPFSVKNTALTEAEVQDRLQHYNVITSYSIHYTKLYEAFRIVGRYAAEQHQRRVHLGARPLERLDDALGVLPAIETRYLGDDRQRNNFV